MERPGQKTTDLLFVDELKDVVDIADHDNLLAYHVFFRREPVTYLKPFIIKMLYERLIGE